MPEQLYSLLPSELNLMINAKKEEVESKIQSDWSRSRLIYSIIYNSNVDSKHRKEPQELIPLAWDDKSNNKHDRPRKLEEMTAEERMKHFEKLDSVYLKKFSEGKAK